MILTSLPYLLLIAALVILYYLSPKKIRWFILLAGGCVFYAGLGITAAVVPVAVTLVSYLSALILQRLQALQQKKDRNPNSSAIRQRLVLAVALIINFGGLAVFKYYGFLAVNATAFLGVTLPSFSLLAPLGISFFTFQAAGYILDVYRGINPAQKNPLKLLLFVCFFPSISQGPISRYSEICDDLYEGRSFCYRNISFGAQRILWGFFKKLVIADRLAILVNTVYSQTDSYPGVYLAVAAVAFSFQLYTDFSGCMDIVIGTAQLFSIKLPENFKNPYFSQTIKEFWRRWHITLGLWFKDYLMYPILKSVLFQWLGKSLKKYFGKKAAKAITTYTGMMILWFVIGLWHGDSWKFIMGVGLLHGVYIIIGELVSGLCKKITNVLKIKTECFSWRLLRQIRTFMLVSISFVFFRAGSFMSAVDILRDIFARFNFFEIFKIAPTELGLDIADIHVVVIALFIVLIVSILQNKTSVRESLAEQNFIFRWLLFYALIFAVIIFGIYGPDYSTREFLYIFF